MSAAPREQRNPYKGREPRPWVRLKLLAVDGSAHEVVLVADTGNPCAVIVGSVRMSQILQIASPPVRSNFGSMTSGWVRVVIPDVGFDKLVLGHAGDVVVATVQHDSPDFEGLVGLPLLRMLEYGGDADWFWIRPAAHGS